MSTSSPPLAQALHSLGHPPLIYTSCYCEENCYKLVERLRSLHVDLRSVHVVFISNPHERAILWRQKSSTWGLNGQVIWDYHVIVVVKSPELPHALVLDFDTTLPLLCPFPTYAREALYPNGYQAWIRDLGARLYRVVSGDAFLEHFASDRSHMIAADGTYNSPPPSYPPIKTKDSTMNLDSYRKMSLAEPSADRSDSKFGTLFTEQQFCNYFLGDGSGSSGE
ncbi:N-terminal glutamine amidase-domain-containing protein [Polychytrium aggregatum]|uniref:N-terminal glutamine amidase-domain-containing protein n=1 Tax=Polychytrium aggregatum TaxID=110093 RepID=UPI0022FE431E|nr:N-terminal glutamine amidase-domain-containing protein [Polychytrium aggregatum]KAI9203589.1 N-terminal glutamine amidase-domain-containing protein [Polychytrium aggregatum]